VRIVDCFTDVILFTRKFVRGEIKIESIDEVKSELLQLLKTSESLAESNNFSHDYYDMARFPVVAFVDESLQCSNWSEKSLWQKSSLQRELYNTTNSGSEFYERLYELNKFGPERDIREVYALCLGLGFRGKYFRGEDRKAYEEVKAFNLSLLLPDEAQRNIDSAVLFPFAYKDYDAESEHDYKARVNFYPIFVGIPIITIVTLLIYFQLDIASWLDQIQELVKQ